MAHVRTTMEDIRSASQQIVWRHQCEPPVARVPSSRSFRLVELGSQAGVGVADDAGIVARCDLRSYVVMSCTCRPRRARAAVAALIVGYSALANAHPSADMSLQRQLGVLVPPDVIEEMRQVSREQVTLAFRICVRGVPHLRVEQLRGRTHQTRAAILHAQAAAEGDSDLSAAAKVLEYSMTLESGSGGLPITTLRRFRPEPGESAARSGLLVSQDTHVQLFAAFPALTLDCPLSPTGSRQEAERVKAALALVQSRDPVSSIEFGDPALAEETFMALTREAAALRAVDAVIDVRIHDEGGHRRLQANRWHFANEALTLFLELRDDGSRLGVTRDVTAPARSAKAGEPAAVRGRMN